MSHNHHPQRQCLGMPIPANVCKTVARLSYTRRVPQLRTALAAIPLPAAVFDPDDGMLAVTMVSADLRGHAVHQVVRGLFDYYDRCGPPTFQGGCNDAASRVDCVIVCGI